MKLISFYFVEPLSFLLKCLCLVYCNRLQYSVFLPDAIWVGDFYQLHFYCDQIVFVTYIFIDLPEYISLQFNAFLIVITENNETLYFCLHLSLYMTMKEFTSDNDVHLPP